MSPLLTRKLASVANRQKLLPLAKVTLEPQAFRYLEARNDAPLELLAGLPTVFCERISCKIRESLDTCRRCSLPICNLKQVPDNLHDWIKSQTFAICAKMALPKRFVSVEMYWIGRKMRGMRPCLASTFTGSLKLRQDVEGSFKSDGGKRRTIPLGFWLCARTA